MELPLYVGLGLVAGGVALLLEKASAGARGLYRDATPIKTVSADETFVETAGADETPIGRANAGARRFWSIVISKGGTGGMEGSSGGTR